MKSYNQHSITPLVSVVVITYNSSLTVVETLESIYQQTYENLELIVSDDCSKDNTVDVVRHWIEEHGDHFVNAKLVTTDMNTGVSGNINRGVAQSHGEWIKSIAGDDLLIPEAIEEYVRFVSGNNSIKMCVCDVEPFAVGGEVDPHIVESYKKYFLLESEPYVKQRRRIMVELVFVGPAYFYKRELFNEIGGFSEQYGCAEEWPFCYKVIREGNQIFALDKKLVRYRIQTGSLCHSRDDRGLGSKIVFDGMYRHYFDYAFKDLLREGYLLAAWHYALSYWSRRLQYNLKNKNLNKLIALSAIALSPLYYLRRLHLVE